jgi:hypothetical protein
MARALHVSASVRADDWQSNGRRSPERLAIALRHLGRYFRGWGARDIDFGALQAY